MNTQDKPRYARNPAVQWVKEPGPAAQLIGRALYFIFALGAALLLAVIALAAVAEVPALGVLLVVFFVIYFAVKAGTRAGRRG